MTTFIDTYFGLEAWHKYCIVLDMDLLKLGWQMKQPGAEKEFGP